LPKRHLSYAALNAFIEKECPDWSRKLIPRNIDAPAQYWPQKVLAVATIQGVLANQIAKDLGDELNLAFATLKEECRGDYPQALLKALDRAEDVIQN
jgi:hypothetical protein